MQIHIEGDSKVVLNIIKILRSFRVSITILPDEGSDSEEKENSKPKKKKEK